MISGRERPRTTDPLSRSQQPPNQMSDQPTEEVQPSPPPTPAPRDATVDEERLRLRHRLSIVLATLGVAGGIRVLIGVLGIGGFVAGVILAWHASSATTLLVVSAALLLFAAIGTEWEEVVASWGSASLKLRRINELEEVVASKEVPEPVREELEAKLADLRAATLADLRAATHAVRPVRLRWLRTVAGDALADEALRASTSHRFSDGSVELFLQAFELDTGYRCTVKTPSGGSFSAVTRRPIATAIPGVTLYRVLYPDEFRGSEPLAAGRYDVEWYATATAPARATALQASLIEGGLGPPLATDSFTIPKQAMSGGGSVPEGAP
jgi:hypothetical protein